MVRKVDRMEGVRYGRVVNELELTVARRKSTRPNIKHEIHLKNSRREGKEKDNNQKLH